MAHITQETKKKIMTEVKQIVKSYKPKAKVTASIRDYCELTIKIKCDELSKEQDDFLKLDEKSRLDNQNYSFPYSNKVKTLTFYKKIEKIICKTGNYYDKTDVYSDYCNKAFYYDVIVLPA